MRWVLFWLAIGLRGCSVDVGSRSLLPGMVVIILQLTLRSADTIQCLLSPPLQLLPCPCPSTQTPLAPLLRIQPRFTQVHSVCRGDVSLALRH